MSVLRNIGVSLAKQGKYDDAIEMLEEAFREGDIEVLNDIGVIYERKEEYSKAMDLYERAGLLGSAVAKYNAGNLCESGKGVNVNYPEALHLYMESAKGKYAPAYFKIASFYQYGKGVERNGKLAFKWAKEGCKYELNSSDGTGCLVNTGYYYEKGIGVKRNYTKALKYYMLAANRKSDVGMFDAVLIYLYKKPNKKNIKRGMVLLYRSARLNYPDAFAELSSIYQEGKIEKQNYDMSSKFLLEGLNKSSWRALLMYARLLISGENPYIKVNIPRAEHAIAMYLANSGEYYEDYLWQYNALKKDFKSKIDFKSIEEDPDMYINSNDDYIA